MVQLAGPPKLLWRVQDLLHWNVALVYSKYVVLALSVCTVHHYLLFMFSSDDIVNDLTATSSQITPRPVTAADVLSVTIEGLESAVAR